MGKKGQLILKGKLIAEKMFLERLIFCQSDKTLFLNHSYKRNGVQSTQLDFSKNWAFVFFHHFDDEKRQVTEDVAKHATHLQ